MPRTVSYSSAKRSVTSIICELLEEAKAAYTPVYAAFAIFVLTGQEGVLYAERLYALYSESQSVYQAKK